MKLKSFLECYAKRFQKQKTDKKDTELYLNYINLPQNQTL